MGFGAFVLTEADAHDLIVHDIMEISYVPRGANRKEYLLVKGMKEDTVKSILETDDPELGKFLKENKIEGEAGEALAVVGRFLKSYKDKLPENTLSLMSKACGYPEPAQPKKTDKAGGAGGQGGDPNATDPDEGADNGCGDGTGGAGDQGYGYPSQKTLKMIEKASPELKALFDGLIQENKATKTEAKEANQRAKGLELKALKKEYMTKAQGLTHIPGISIQKMADDMLVMGEAHPEQFAELYKALLTADKLLEKSAAWEGMGRGHTGLTGSTYDKILTMAKALVEKGEEELTLEAAIEKVLDIHPDMYDEYEAERKAAVGEV